MPSTYCSIYNEGRESASVTAGVVTSVEDSYSGELCMECMSDDDRDAQDVDTLKTNPDERIEVVSAAASGGGGALPAIRPRSTTIGLILLETYSTENGVT
jgi:hypothetical protein